jgi:hypothetical protein
MKFSKFYTKFWFSLIHFKDYFILEVKEKLFPCLTN